MSRRTNFLDGNDEFRNQNLRFVKNELEDNFNQFFGGEGSGVGPGPTPSGARSTGNGAPPRDSIVVQPTPDTDDNFKGRNYELTIRRQYMRQLGVNRKEAHSIAVASMKLPDFNMHDFQRKRFRLSVELGDSRQAEVNAEIVREINTFIKMHEQRRKDRPRTPPPPCNINWNASRESSPDSRDIPRQREPSSENYGLVRRTDDSFQAIQPINSKRNDKVRQVERNDSWHRVEQNDNFRGHQHQNIGRNENFRGDHRGNDHYRTEKRQNIERNDSIRQVERNINRNENFHDGSERNFERNDNFHRRHQNIERNDNLRGQRHDSFQGGHNNERIDNFRGNERSFERDERFRGQETRNFQRNDNFRETEHFENNNSGFLDNRRSPKIEHFRGEENHRFVNNNREPDFDLVRRQASPDFRGSFDRNFERTNNYDYERNDQDFQSVPLHLQNNNYCGNSRENIHDEFRHVNDMNDFSNDRNQMRSPRFEDNFREQQPKFEPCSPNAREDDFTFPHSEFPDSVRLVSNFDNRFCDQQRNDFESFPDQLNFDRKPHNSDYNAVLDNDGRLAIDRWHFDNDFHNRLFENRGDYAHFRTGELAMDNDGNQMNWTDDHRSYGFPDDNRNINPNREQLQNHRSVHTRNPMNRTRSKSNSQTKRNVGGTRSSQQPPIRRLNTAPEKTATATSTASKNAPTIGNSKGSKDLPQTATATGSQYTNQNRILLPAPTAAARAIGQKHLAESDNSAQRTKKQKTAAIKRGFLVGGFKLPYINNNVKPLPQPEEKSYAVTFFEQKPIYNTSIFALDNDGCDIAFDTDHDGDDNSDDDDGPSDNMQPVLLGKMKRTAIRKRINKTWTKIYRWNNYKCWRTWWIAYKWCEQEINKKLEKFGSLNIKNKFLPSYPKKTTKQVINIVMRSAHFALEENTPKHFRDLKTLYVLMNDTFLENLTYPVMEQLQDMIRSTPNHLWVYKMRSMVYLWAEYFKIASPNKGNPRDFVAIQAKWKSPVFHWLCKQSFDELKAISAVEWKEHNQVFPNLESFPA